jgi:Cu2+-exporting ATPase
MSTTATLGTCFHCREPLANSKLLARIGDRSEPVCCRGCLAVAEMIAVSGLADFYARRTLPSPKPDETQRAADTWRAYVRPDVAAQFVRRGATSDSVDLLIENLRCSACGWLIEHTVRRLPGVTAIDVNASLGRARVEWANDASQLEPVMRAIAQLGYVPHPATDDTAARVYRHERRTMLKRFVVATFGMMQVMMFALAGYSASLSGETIDPTLDHYFRLVSLLISVPVLSYAARPFLVNGWNSLRARAIGMDLPVSAALLLAFTASAWNTLVRSGEVYFDSITMFVFFMTLSRLIELQVRHRTNSVTDALARHLPATAQRIVGDRVETVATAQLRRGDIVLVPSGATAPVDGRIISGQTTINESLLTGESLPVMRRAGESLASGSINVGSPIQIEVTATGVNTTLSHIVALVRRAQTQRPVALFAADRAASVFLRIVLVASACVCATWLVVDPSRAFGATLAVLVVACPCAFSIAMPAALAASTAQLARQGVLVTKPGALEALTRVRHVIFDKTGTLTRGEATLDACAPSGPLTREQCLSIAAALELSSDHPIAGAFSSIPTLGIRATDLTTVSGFGVEGTIDGRRYRIGIAGFVAELRGATHSHDADDADIHLGDERNLLATFVVSDSPRDDSCVAVRQLERAGIETTILSGDGHAAVAAIARRCGVSRFLARRTPRQKLAHVRELQAHGHAIAMVGDGINDAPVLGAADVSIAMGRGAALAVAAADLILVAERPSTIMSVIDVAHRTVTIARQNLIWSATYNFCALPLAAVGLISPWIAALGMSASSLFVLLNALRLLPRAATAAPPAADALAHPA